MTAPNSASVRAPDCPLDRAVDGKPCEGPGTYYCDMGPCQRLLEDRAQGIESPAESLARRFHQAYEQLAPAYSYATRRDSAVPWSMVPERNRRLMVATAQAVLDDGAASRCVVCSSTEHDSESHVRRLSYDEARAIQFGWTPCAAHFACIGRRTCQKPEVDRD